MKVDVTFANFPVSDSTRQMLAERINELVSKFSRKMGSVRAVFGTEGYKHTVRIHARAGNINTFVSAAGPDMGRCVDEAIDKLETSLRKIHAKKSHRRHDNIRQVFQESLNPPRRSWAEVWDEGIFAVG